MSSTYRPPNLLALRKPRRPNNEFHAGRTGPRSSPKTRKAGRLISKRSPTRNPHRPVRTDRSLVMSWWTMTVRKGRIVRLVWRPRTNPGRHEPLSFLPKDHRRLFRTEMRPSPTRNKHGRSWVNSFSNQGPMIRKRFPLHSTMTPHPRTRKLKNSRRTTRGYLL